MHERNGNLRAVAGCRPDALGDVLAGVVTDHRVRLEQAALAGFHADFVGGLRRGERGVDVTQPFGRRFRVDRQRHGVGRFVRTHDERLAGFRQHADAAQAFGALAQRDESIEQFGAGKEHVLVVRDPFLPAGTVACLILGHRHQAEVRRIPIGADDPAAVVVICVIEEVALTRCKHAELRRVGQFGAAHFAGYRALQRDAQVLLRAGAEDRHVEGFVSFLVHQHVVTGGRAKAMRLDAFAEQCGRIVLDEIQGAFIRTPRQHRCDAFDAILQQRAGGKLLDAQDVLATTHIVFHPRQQLSVRADGIAADLEIPLAFGQGIAIEQDFLGCVHAALAARMDRVLATFLETAVVPVALAQERHAGIVGLDARDDFLVKRFARFAQWRNNGVGVGVLGVQIRDHFRVLPAVVAQPVVRIFPAGPRWRHHLMGVRCGNRWPGHVHFLAASIIELRRGRTRRNHAEGQRHTSQAHGSHCAPPSPNKRCFRKV